MAAPNRSPTLLAPRCPSATLKVIFLVCILFESRYLNFGESQDTLGRITALITPNSYSLRLQTNTRLSWSSPRRGRYFKTKISYYPNCASTFAIQRIILSGDIHINLSSENSFMAVIAYNYTHLVRKKPSRNFKVIKKEKKKKKKQ